MGAFEYCIKLHHFLVMCTDAYRIMEMILENFKCTLFFKTNLVEIELELKDLQIMGTLAAELHTHTHTCVCVFNISDLKHANL